MADFTGFVAGGSTFSVTAPSTLKHGRTTGSVSDTIHWGDSKITLGSIDRETPGTLTIAGTGSVSTGVSIGRFGLNVNFPGPVVFADFWTQSAIPSPSLSPPTNGRIYFDNASNKFKVSENGGAFVDLVGSSGVTGSGSVDRITLWSGPTSLTSDTDLFYNSTTNRLGIGTATPNESIEVGGAILIGSAVNALDGTIQWTGADFEGRKGGAWTSLTTGGGGGGGWSDDGVNVRLTTITDSVGIGTATPDNKFHVVDSVSPASKYEVTTAATSTTAVATVFKRTSSANMVDGFGPSLAFAIEDVSAVENQVATIEVKRDGADTDAEMGLYANNIRLDPDSGYVTLGTLATETGTQELRKGWGGATLPLNNTGWGKGSEYTDLVNAYLYINAGTEVSVSWVKVGQQS